MVQQTLDLKTFVRIENIYLVNAHGRCMVDTISYTFRDYTTKTPLYENGVWGPASTTGSKPLL